MRGAEWGFAILLTAFALSFHFVFFTHVGPLWRDEINSVAFAGMPSVASIWEFLRYDSFPMLSTIVLRGWMASGLGSTDPGLRVYGLLVGILVLGAVWTTGRLLGAGVPVVSLALVGVNPWVVRTVDSIRPYGLGIALIVATLGCVWKAVETSRPKWFLIAGVLAVLSVQCMYQNAFLLFAICSAGTLAALRDSRFKTAIAVVGIGLIAACSLVPYLPSLAASRSWGDLIRFPVPMSRLWDVLIEALGLGRVANAWPWFVLAILVVWQAAGGLRIRSRQGAVRARSQVALFGAGILALGVTVYLAALKSTQLQTEAWYYVPLAVFVAPALDAASALFSNTERRRIARLAFAMAAALTVGITGWNQVHTRWTNIDLVAAGLEARAVAGDTIVLNPFWLGMTFQRHYHGPAAWVTIPPIEDLHIVRYDMLKAAMARPGSIDPVLRTIAGTLQSGHKVWWVAGFPSGEENGPPAVLPPAPLPASGWFMTPYLFDWGTQAAYLLKAHGLESEILRVHPPGPVAPYEDVRVTAVSGWH